MEAKTRDEYISIANNFLKRLGDEITPKRITDELKKAAGDYRPDYWRRLRRGLEIQQREAGFTKAADRIKGLKNPVTSTLAKGDRTGIKPKQRRAKTIKRSDTAKLIMEAEKRGMHELAAAIYVASETGARPAEMPNIVVLDGILAITGVKKREGSGVVGSRGLDRNLVYEGNIERMELCLGRLRGADMHKVQQQIRRLTREVWPTRKTYPSLYTWRHQYGSNMKASGMSRVEIAYCMGHQSTVSVERYGNARSANAPVRLRPAPGADFSQIRERHTAPPGPRLARAVEVERVRETELRGPSL